ncbi:hypothetical protein A3K01_01620 [candidate division WWE3 bacterium RIFOXYD1_FULL_43_17]|uniref:Histidine kinase N-terminal 7TM region domain-containing protein n=3 Tax=Katanobacteria TaxID=422282 RepID=A0A1F4XFY9_UNCKA|nr:MAG: hypothetical protein UU59_C0012G0012 [candidate division WWE3 bacterium GW2011_GWE1_41_27]KKS59258.1 MAG: hypothetical protein UV26_C0026G0013 [candidate division WWE3 bacterium GW2011_GWF2_42_42]OGC80516.1 MAG: hypothetical protein A3K01_01620 [candidate division WWE3 bacterium RIFOXYD1_FULL_43_17]
MSLKKIANFFAVLLLVVYTFWWVWLAFFVSPESSYRHGFSITYGVIAGYGGFLGLIIARKFGGLKSYVGKSLIFFSLGLLGQFFGQLAYDVEYYITYVENAYPSYGEIFFFSSIPFYIFGVWYIGKASGWGVSLRSLRNKIGSIIFPIIIVAISYFMFIKGSDFTGQSLIAIILSFAYPIGQAIFVSLALLAYYLSGNVLGGAMKNRVIFILFSLVFQYVADTVFLYKTIQGTWMQADFSEYLFALSYALMTFAIIEFLVVYHQLEDKK